MIGIVDPEHRGVRYGLCAELGTTGGDVGVQVPKGQPKMVY